MPGPTPETKRENLCEPATLNTGRILLRPWKDEDYTPFHVMSSDPRVYEFLPRFADKAASDAFADMMRRDFSRRGWGFWVLEHKESGAFMGIAGMHEPGPEFGVGRPCVEIGWRLDPAFWGGGFATEAAREVMRFAFCELRLDELVSFTAVGNERSYRLMERLGMEREKEFDLLKFSPGDPNRRSYLYALTRQKWLARNKQGSGPITRGNGA